MKTKKYTEVKEGTISSTTESQKLMAIQRMGSFSSKTAACVFALLFTLLFFLPGVFAAIPSVLNVQGRLTDINNETTLTGGQSFIFNIYNVQTGGNQLWQESKTLYVSTDGLWSTLLGSITPLNLTFDEPYYLEVIVNGETLSPRYSIGSTAYTLKSNRTDFVAAGGQALGDFKVSGVLNITGGEGWLNGSRICTSTNSLCTISAGGWSDLGPIIALSDSNDIVSIGTQTPEASQKLTVLGNANITGYLYVADSSAASSAGKIYIGSTTSDGLEYIRFDPTLGSKGKFVFSAPLQVASSSPGITFYDPNQPTNTSRQASISYNYSADYPITMERGVEINGSLSVLGASPATIIFGRGNNTQTLSFDTNSQEFQFSGGKIKQDFSNIIKNGGFESFSGGGTWSGNEITALPDDWYLVQGSSYQYSPSTYTIGADVFQGFNAVKLVSSGGGVAKITQNIPMYKLQPNRTYSVGVFAKVSGTGNAKLNIAGSAITGTFTEINSTSTQWTLLRGQFTTLAMILPSYNVVIELKGEGLTTNGGGGYVYFDAIQVNTGNVLGEYQEPPLTAIGDQSIYGGLRIQRTGYTSGGILSVDQFVRTREIQFSYNTDPGYGGIYSGNFSNPQYTYNYVPGNAGIKLGGDNSLRIYGTTAGYSELNFRFNDTRGITLTTMNPDKLIILDSGLDLNISCTSGQVLSTLSDGTMTCVTDNTGASSWSGTPNYIPKFDTSTSLTNSVMFENAGNVGIGTTSPGVLLDVNGSLRARDTVSNLNFVFGELGGNNRMRIYSTGPTIRFIDSTNSYAQLGFGGLALGDYGATSAGSGNIITSGKVGIGTTLPNATLQVQGVANVLALNVNNTLYVNTTTSNVGIGTASPTQKLDVNGSINVSSASGIVYAPQICLGGNCITNWPAGITSITAGEGLNATTITTSGTLNVNLTYLNTKYMATGTGITLPTTNVTGLDNYLSYLNSTKANNTWVDLIFARQSADNTTHKAEINLRANITQLTSINAIQLGGQYSTYFINQTNTTIAAATLGGQVASFFVNGTDAGRNGVTLPMANITQTAGMNGTNWSYVEAWKFGSQFPTYYINQSNTTIAAATLGGQVTSYYLNITNSTINANTLSGQYSTYYLNQSNNTICTSANGLCASTLPTSAQFVNLNVTGQVNFTGTLYGNGANITNVNAIQLGSQISSFFLNTTTSHGGDVSGTYNNILVTWGNGNNKLTLNAANITAGTFPSGLFAFPGTVNISGAMYLGNSKCSSGYVLTADPTTGLLSCVVDQYTSANASASGSTGYLSKFTNATTLVNSGVYENSTTGNIGIGMLAPAYKLDVAGTISGSIDASNITSGTLPDARIANATNWNNVITRQSADNTTLKAEINLRANITQLTSINAIQLGGQYSTYFINQSNTTIAAATLGGQVASFFVNGTDAGRNGVTLPMANITQTAGMNGTNWSYVEAWKFGSQFPTYYINQSNTTIAAATLGGQVASYYLNITNGTINAATLGGQISSFFLNGTDNTRLGNYDTWLNTSKQPLLNGITIPAANITAGTFPTGTYIFSGSSSNALVVNGTTGNVGIGTTSPEASLHIDNANAGILRLTDSAASADGEQIGGIQTAIGDGTYFAGINFYRHDADDGEIRLREKVAGTNTDVMTIVDGKVGIGTTTPTSSLQINSSNNYGGLEVTNSTGSSRFFVNASSGNVGIGTTNPTKNLEVKGSGSQYVAVEGTSAGIFDLKQTGQAQWRMLAQNNFNFQDATNSKTPFVIAANAGDNLLYLTSGNVGIGTTNPVLKLDVNGAIHLNYSNYSTPVQNSTFQSIIIPNTGTISMESTAGYVRTLIGTDAGGNIDIGQTGTSIIPSINLKAGNAGYISLVPGGGEAVRVISSGNVGINTTSPDSILHVQSNANARVRIADYSDTFNPSILLSRARNTATTPLNVSAGDILGAIQTQGWKEGSGFINGGAITFNATGNASGGRTPTDIMFNAPSGSADVQAMVIKSGGNVGIGTANPSDLLHLYKDYTGQIGLRIENPHTTANGGVQVALSRGETYRPAQIIFQNGTTDEWYIGELYNGGSGNTKFSIATGSSLSNSKVVVDSAGNVGIGTTSPTQKLDVNGSINVSSASGIVYAPQICLGGNCITNWPGGITSITAGEGLNATTITTSGTLHVNLTYLGTKFIDEGQAAGGDLSGTYPNPTITWSNGNNKLTLDAANITSGTLPVARGGTGTSTPFTIGSVIFADTSGIYQQDNSNLFWDNTNDRLGIGTAVPTSRLHVVGDVYLAGTATGMALNVNNSLYVNGTTGNVGIGTTTPAEKLQVSGGAIAVNGSLSAHKTSALTLAQDSSTTSQIRAYGPDATTPGNLSFVGLANDGSPQWDFFINSLGNVGIGTTAPSNLFTVEKASTSGLVKIYNTAGTITDGQAILEVRSDDTSDPAAHDLLNLNNGGTVRMLVEAGGNVGIGTTSPGAKLEVSGMVLATNFSGSGANLSNVNAALLGGQLPSYYLNTGTSFGGDVSGAYNNIQIGSGVIGDTELAYDTGQALTTTSSPTFSNLIVSNNLYVIGNLSNANINNLTINGSIIPPDGFDNQFDLGTPARRWKAGYFAGMVLAANFSGSGANLSNVNAALLGGQISSYYLNITNGTINAATLGGQISSYYLNGTDNTRLGNYDTWLNTSKANNTEVDTLRIRQSADNTTLKAEINLRANITQLGSYQPLLNGITIPAANITSGTFGTGNYMFQGTVILGNSSTGSITAGTDGQIEHFRTSVPYYDFKNNLSDDYDIRLQQMGNDSFQIRSPSVANILFLNGTTGNVGIGTVAPQGALHVSVADTKPAASYWKNIIQDTTAYATGVGGGIQFAGYKNSPAATEFFAAIDGYKENAAAGDAAGAFRILTQPASGAGLVERMRVGSTGNVGIGTTSPGATLHVDAAGGGIIRATRLGSGAGVIQLEADGTDGTLATTNKMFFGTGGSTRMTILGTGNVGIGTTSPSRILHISGAGSTAGMRIDINATQNLFTFVGAGSSNPDNLDAIQQMYSQNVEKIRLYANGDSFFNGGNVGIGTTNPGAKLNVEGTAQDAIQSLAIFGANNSISQNKQFLFRMTANNTAPIALLRTTSTAGNDPKLGFAVGTDVPSLTVITGGNVGIGTISPGYLLDVNGTIRTNGQLRITGNSAGTSWTDTDLVVGDTSANRHDSTISIMSASSAGKLKASGNTLNLTNWDGQDMWTFKTNVLQSTGNAYFGGNVGIGTTTPNQKLEIYGAAGSPATSGTTQNGLFRMTNSANDLAFDFGSIAGSPYTSWIQNTNKADLSFYYPLSLNPLGGNVGIGTTTPNEKLAVAGNASFTGTVTVGGGTGKINVGTIDPVYNISGQKYATYLPSMTGVKEETTGTVRLNGKANNGVHKYVIDFSKVQEGSDLWLFYQATDFGNSMENVQVILTPAFDGKVWYEKDGKKLTIFGKSDGNADGAEVSYRLTANRFDWKQWSNRADSNVAGFSIEKK